ncbi:MAG: LamG domain-containing protein [Myxococcales bacterium FL481]|nr:MAG: LamG domain-containing protein [Myxococcales bacterium FL481]
MRLAFTAGDHTGSFTDFPVAVVLNESRVDYSHFAAQGQNLRFYDDDQLTLLPHEVAFWSVSEPSTLWVGVPVLDPAVDEDGIWIYFSCTDPAEADAAGVWDPHYDGVWHLDRDYRDSTSHAADGVETDVDIMQGVQGWAANFDHDGASLDLGGDARLREAATVSLWGKYDALGAGTGNNTFITCGGPNGSEPDNFQYTLSISDERRLVSHWEPEPNVWIDVQSDASAGSTVGRWHHYVMVRSSETERVRYHFDGEPLGAEQTYAAPPSGGGSGRVWLGNTPIEASPWWLDGSVDEVRLTREQLSAAWVRVEFQSATDALIDYGVVESR